MHFYLGATLFHLLPLLQVREPSLPESSNFYFSSRFTNILLYIYVYIQLTELYILNLVLVVDELEYFQVGNLNNS